MTNLAMVAWGGLAIGILFGAVGQRTGFCMLSGLRGAWVQGDGRMLRSFVLALAVAMLASNTLQALGYVDLRDSIYVQRTFSPLLYLAGGALFGFGMVLSNGCGARSLVLLGSGNLRSLLVLLCLGLAGHMTLTGLLAQSRLTLADTTSVTLPLPQASLVGVAEALGLAGAAALWLPVAGIVAGLLLFCLADAGFRRSPRHLAGGLLIGALVAAGWYVTGHLGYDDFDPVDLASLTFIAPIGDTMQYIMLATGLTLRFGVTVVAGVVAGSLLVALITRSFQVQGFSSPAGMLRYIAGGILMGIGGALALGCSIGQGLTGMSTLAVPSLVALAGILLGAWLGLKGRLRLPPP